MHIRLAALLTLLLLSASLALGQGNLTPPGAPAATMKTLDQLDTHLTAAGEKRIDVLSLPGDGTNQYIISAQGSYYLSGKITGVSGKNGISIQAGNVVLDLSGYQLTGVSGALSGVVVGGSHSNIQVRNGSISQWPGTGLDLSSATNQIVSDIVSVINFLYGIRTGDTGVISRCTTRANGGDNLLIGANSTVNQCIGTGSIVGNGINVGQNSSVTDCSASLNFQSGIVTDVNCVLTRVTATGNGVNGISVGQNSSMTDCTANSNVQAGVSTGTNCRESGVTANQNTGHGMILGNANEANMCVANLNTLNGFEGSQRDHFFRCSALFNGQSGIHASFVPVVDGCYCEHNGNCGILADTGGLCTITNNACHENGNVGSIHGAGIRMSGGVGSRVERNAVTLNYFGIDVQTVGNVIVANTASLNTVNFNFVAGNRYGPIIDDTATDPVSAPAVTGNSAAGDINATSPWANFSH